MLPPYLSKIPLGNSAQVAQSQITAGSVISVDLIKLIKSWDRNPIIVKHEKSVWKIGQNIPINYQPCQEVFLEKIFQKAPVLYSSRYRLLHLSSEQSAVRFCRTSAELSDKELPKIWFGWFLTMPQFGLPLDFWHSSDIQKNPPNMC